MIERREREGEREEREKERERKKGRRRDIEREGYKNYHEQLWGEIITGNYEWKISVEIMSENYQLVYYHAKNVRYIGILAYPKILN